MIRQDRREEENKWRDRLEYLASFWNSEAVSQIQQAREQAETTGKTSNEAFSTILKYTFGRGLGSDAYQRAQTVQQLGAQIREAGV